MVIWDAKAQQAVVIDYREQAPLRASRDMFAPPGLEPAAGTAAEEARSSRSVPSSLYGGLSVAVPGHVAGLCFALERFGTMSLSEVIAPALRLAEHGAPADPQTVAAQKRAFQRIADAPDGDRRFRQLTRWYLNGGKPLRVGERVVSPQAAVLRRIARCGRSGFYAGPVAGDIIRTVQADGGLITQADLRMVKPVVREPVRGRCGPYEIISMPPPSSGGVALVEILNILEAYEAAHLEGRLERLGQNSPAYLHLLIEAMKHAFADRASYLGDADFAQVPVQRLISRTYAAARARQIRADRTQPPAAYGGAQTPSDQGTSHFSVIDAQGNAVACTETINATFGSLLVTPRFGIVLNNEMDDFAARPGQPNLYGLIQSEANAVAPRKRPLSSMTPTIVLQNGRAVHVLGASGGPRIISTTVQVLLNLVRFDMTPRQAVDQPRVHHQWFPDEAYVEPPLFAAVREELERRGHRVLRRKALAVCQVASRLKGRLRGAADRRKHGRAAGW